MKIRQAAKAKPAVVLSPEQSLPAMQVAAVIKDGRGQAEIFAREPRRLKSLLAAAVAKTGQADKTAFKGLWPYLLAMLRLVRAFCNGKYKRVPWESLISIIVAIAYFASPLDLIPDFLPGVGYLDDAMIVRFVYRSVKAELERFMEWESGIDRPF